MFVWLVGLAVRETNVCGVEKKYEKEGNSYVLRRLCRCFEDGRQEIHRRLLFLFASLNASCISDEARRVRGREKFDDFLYFILSKY